MPLQEIAFKEAQIVGMLANERAESYIVALDAACGNLRRAAEAQFSRAKTPEEEGFARGLRAAERICRELRDGINVDYPFDCMTDALDIHEDVVAAWGEEEDWGAIHTRWVEQAYAIVVKALPKAFAAPPTAESALSAATSREEEET